MHSRGHLGKDDWKFYDTNKNDNSAFVAYKMMG